MFYFNEEIVHCLWKSSKRCPAMESIKRVLYWKFWDKKCPSDLRQFPSGKLLTFNIHNCPCRLKRHRWFSEFGLIQNLLGHATWQKTIYHIYTRFCLTVLPCVTYRERQRLGRRITSFPIGRGNQFRKQRYQQVCALTQFESVNGHQLTVETQLSLWSWHIAL